MINQTFPPKYGELDCDRVTRGCDDVLRGGEREEKVLRGDEDGVVQTGEAGLSRAGVISFTRISNYLKTLSYFPLSITYIIERPRPSQIKRPVQA